MSWRRRSTSSRLSARRKEASCLDSLPLRRNNLRRIVVTRLTDLPPAQAKRLAELECPDFATRPWVTGSALSQRRVAIVSSAGLVVRGEDPFRGRDADCRDIACDTAPN